MIAGLISSYFGMLRGQDTYFQVNTIHFSVTGAVTRLATAGRLVPRRQPKNALHYVVEHIRCRKSARRVRRAGGGNVPTGLGLRPGAKAPDEPPTPYRLRASPRLYPASCPPRAGARCRTGTARRRRSRRWCRRGGRPSLARRTARPPGSTRSPPRQDVVIEAEAGIHPAPGLLLLGGPFGPRGDDDVVHGGRRAGPVPAPRSPICPRSGSWAPRSR